MLWIVTHWLSSDITLNHCLINYGYNLKQGFVLQMIIQILGCLGIYWSYHLFPSPIPQRPGWSLSLHHKEGGAR